MSLNLAHENPYYSSVSFDKIKEYSTDEKVIFSFWGEDRMNLLCLKERVFENIKYEHSAD